MAMMVIVVTINAYAHAHHPTMMNRFVSVLRPAGKVHVHARGHGNARGHVRDFVVVMSLHRLQSLRQTLTAPMPFLALPSLQFYVLTFNLFNFLEKRFFINSVNQEAHLKSYLAYSSETIEI